MLGYKYREIKKAPSNNNLGLVYGGEAGIRTLGRFNPSPVFKTGTFGRSVTSPFSLVA